MIGPKLLAEFLKALYWDLYFSISLLMTFFLSLKNQIFVISHKITLFSQGTNLPLILNNLEHDMRNLLYLFKINPRKGNPGNVSFMMLGKKNRLKCSLEMGSMTLKEFDEVGLLGITIDKALNFRKRIENLCCTVQYKFHALRRIREILDIRYSQTIRQCLH